MAIVLAAICTGLVVLFTLPSVSRLGRASTGWKKSNGPIHLRDVYEDEDGVATEESEEEYSDVLPKRIFYMAAVAGFATSVTSAVLSTIWSSSHFAQPFMSAIDWLNVSIWVSDKIPFSSASHDLQNKKTMLLVQTVSMGMEKSTVTRFRIGVEAAFSSFMLLIVLLVQNGLITNRMETTGTVEKAEMLSKVHLGLGAGQLLFSVITIGACVSLPRRPAVFMADGRAVDNQFTTSAYGRYTFGWLQPLLELSGRKTLELTDLPHPDHKTR